MSYQELSIEERITIQLGQLQGLSQRALARMLDRSPSTISREIRRNAPSASHYSANQAHQHMRRRRVACRPQRKLVPGSKLFELVVHLLRKRFSPQQIAGKLRAMEFTDLEDAYVCRETIYNAIYALPVGELRKELIICLRQGKTSRRPRTGGVDRRGQIPDLVSIHVRPPEVEDRQMPGHWEGDLPKGTDLSGHSQEQLDAIAYELNIRPRQRFDYKCPIEMMTAMMAKHHESPSLIQ